MSALKKTVDPQLNASFAKLSKPAQRALLQYKIFSPSDLSQWTRGNLAKMHGIGPASFPALDQVLAEAGLKLKA